MFQSRSEKIMSMCEQQLKTGRHLKDDRQHNDVNSLENMPLIKSPEDVFVSGDIDDGQQMNESNENEIEIIRQEIDEDTTNCFILEYQEESDLDEEQMKVANEVEYILSGEDLCPTPTMTLPHSLFTEEIENHCDVIIDEIPSQPQCSVNQFAENSRWKKRNPTGWKRNVQKEKMDRCLPYVNRCGVVKSAKLPKIIDCSACRFKCSQNFTEKHRKDICETYWRLGTFERKKDYILINVEINPPKTRKVRITGRLLRKNAKSYHFVCNDIRIRVCQFFFLKTLCISNTVVMNAFKARNDQGGFNGSDMRGHKIPPNKTKSEDVNFVKRHIERYPKMESHYTRTSSNRQYLDGNLSISKMFDQYICYCEENDKNPVSAVTYRRIFSRSFNLSFFRPKKDQCVTCLRYGQASNEEKLLLEDDYRMHIERKDAAEQSKRHDKNNVLVESNNSIIVTFDMQKVLQIPSSRASLMYYLRKLNMFNLTIYEGTHPNKGYCYAWSEVDGKRGACEIGTCLAMYIKKEIPITVKHIVLYSDTCGGQNRNIHVAALFLHLVQSTHLDVIEHKFLESGHSYMEVDSMHSAIEHTKRYVDVFCVQDWLNIFKKSRASRKSKNANKPPYEVRQVTYKDVQDLKKLSKAIIKNKNIDENNERINWLKVKCFMYEKKSPSAIFYRYDYSTAYKKINTLGNRQARRSDLPLLNIDIPCAYFAQLNISDEKKKDLLTMCRNKIVPPELHPWYENLPTNSTANTLPEPSEFDSDVEEE